jgi:hypothetical protein
MISIDIAGLIAFSLHLRARLVALFIQIAGYRCLSLTRAFGVVKCQLALVFWVLRSCSHAAIFLGEGLLVGDAAIEALRGEHAEFGFRQIEPTAVLWRVVPFEALDQAPWPRRPETPRTVTPCSGC